MKLAELDHAGARQRRDALHKAQVDRASAASGNKPDPGLADLKARAKGTKVAKPKKAKKH